MSNTVSGLVFDNLPYGDDRYKILVALADWANDDGYAYGSIIKLARKARVSYRNCIYTIQRLENERLGGENGEPVLRVIRHKRKGYSNDYFINVGLLETLPYYWPDYLLKRLGEARVQYMHPKKTKKKPVEKGASKGADGGNLRVQGRVQRLGATHAPHPSCQSPIMNQPHDSASVSHDGETPVDNSQGELFDDLKAPGDLVKYMTGSTALPRRGRWVNDQSDPGGWSAAEVLHGYKEMVPRPPNDNDKNYLESLGKLGFSTDLTIYLMQEVKRKAKQPPGSMKYFFVSLQKLWTDIQHAIRGADEETQGMTDQQAFWYKNALVMREIALWQRWLNRS